MSGRFVALAVIAGLLLAGCGSSGGAAPRSSAVASTDPASVTSPVVPTSSAAPAPPTVPADVPGTGPNLKYRGEKPPVMPVLATQHTRAGAVAFAEFFIKTIDWGYATTSSAYMRHYSRPSCITCTSIARAIDGAATRKRRFVGDRITVKSVSDFIWRTESSQMTVTYAVDSGEVVDAQGEFVDGAPAFNATDRISESWTSAGWIVSEINPVGSQ